MTTSVAFKMRFSTFFVAAVAASFVLFASAVPGEARNGSYGVKVSGGVKHHHYGYKKRFTRKHFSNRHHRAHKQHRYGNAYRHYGHSKYNKGRFSTDLTRSGVVLGNSSGKVRRSYKHHYYGNHHDKRSYRRYVKPGHRHHLSRHALKDSVSVSLPNVVYGNDYYYPLPIDDGRKGFYYTEVIPVAPRAKTPCPSGYNCGYRLYENGTGPRLITPGFSTEDLPPQDGISGPRIIRLGD